MQTKSEEKLKRTRKATISWKEKKRKINFKSYRFLLTLNLNAQKLFEKP